MPWLSSPSICVRPGTTRPIRYGSNLKGMRRSQCWNAHTVSCRRPPAQPFEVALAVTRAGNLFTTHTAVAAGFDRFDPTLIQQYLGGYAEQRLGITAKDLLALGRQNPDDPTEPFIMAYLAVRGSGAVNGVSRLHGKVSRGLFQPLFPRWPAGDIPVGHMTNGVHVPSWDSAAADDLWTGICGKGRWLGTTETLEQEVRQVSRTALWQFRTAAGTTLVEFARERLSRQLAAFGASPEAVEDAKYLFDTNTLSGPPITARSASIS